MSEWAPKRFYKDASVQPQDGGFAVRLDDRPIRTPGKRLFVLPSSEMAEAAAEEWRAQDKIIDPRTMPWTRSANSALDKVAGQRREVIGHLADYAATDLLFYRAEKPESLIERQDALWNPILEWATARFDARFRITAGVMPVEQNPGSVGTLVRTMEPMTDFQLTGFHDLVTLSGSFLIALAAIENLQNPEILWAVSRLDEAWQAELWGADEEASEAAERKRLAFRHAHDFYRTA